MEVVARSGLDLASRERLKGISSPQDGVPAAGGSLSSNADLSQAEISDSLRRHGGNIPTLPQTKQCPNCPAKFTRTTHLNRHLKTHSSARPHKCDACGSDFTRSDLLTRHKKSCTGVSRTRRNQGHVVAPASQTAWREDDAASTLSGSVTNSSIASSKETDDVSSVLSFHTAESAVPPANLPSLFAGSAHVFDGLFTGIFTPPASEAASGTAWAGLPTPSSRPGHSHQPPTPLAADSATPVSRSVDAPPPMKLSPRDLSVSDESITDLLLSFGEFDNTTPKMQPQALPNLDRPPLSDSSPQASTSASTGEPTSLELDNYMCLFFSHFSPQMPLVHAPTWTLEGKSQILLTAMRAAGALYARTPRAASFIVQTLHGVRQTLLADLMQVASDSSDLTYTIIATVILQFVGLFHQDPKVRASHHIFHGVLVQMIRTRRLISENAAWNPPELTNIAAINAHWRDWLSYETLKRALLLSWVLDCCHVVYFGLPGSFTTSEFTLNLVSEDALWRADSSEEWLRLLQRPSLFGLPDWRLRGFPFQKSLHAMSNAAKLEAINEHCLLNANAHWIAAHTILRNLYSLCPQADTNSAWVEIKRSARTGRTPRHRTKVAHELSDIPDGVDGTEVLQMQYVLQNWLTSYFRAPEVQEMPGSEGPYMSDALPYYWLAQVSLMALQEGMPPFVPDATPDTDARFRLVKHWFRRVRAFLRTGSRQPTMLWNDMMKIRLQAAVGTDDNDGLLDLFPGGLAEFWNSDVTATG